MKQQTKTREDELQNRKEKLIDKYNNMPKPKSMDIDKHTKTYIDILELEAQIKGIKEGKAIAITDEIEFLDNLLRNQLIDNEPYKAVVEERLKQLKEQK